MEDFDFAENLRAPGINLGISTKYQSRMISRCDRPDKRNSLWTDWIAPALIIDNLDMHIPVHQDKKSTFSHHGSKHAEQLLSQGNDPQIVYSLFSNAMLMPAFQYDDGKWQRPRERTAVAPFMIFTFEADNTDLQIQIDWVWSKDENGWSALDRLDRQLAQEFKDYRGYCIVWSGNKSLHIHFIFASAHLSRETMNVMARLQGKSAVAHIQNHWNGDIDPALLWDYYSERWGHLEDILRSVTGIMDEFDPSMRLLHQKRRLPWGLREAAADNTFGLKENDLVPQIVLEEHIRKTAAKGARGYFLSAVEASNMQPAGRPKQRSGQRCDDLYPHELLPVLTEYLRDGWGTEYPKPAAITDEANGVTVWFHNSAADQNPRSFISEDYRAMYWCGRDAPIGESYKLLPDTSLTMGELLIELQADIDAKAGNLNAQSIPQGRNGKRGATIRMFAKHLLSTAPKHLRPAMSIVAWDVSQRYARNMIVSTEGGGKTTAAIRSAGRFRLDDMANNFFGCSLIAPGNGFQVVAGSSYKQAREHFEAYHDWWAAQNGLASIELPAPILLQSFSEHYRQYCVANELTPFKQTEALEQGYNSLVAAVHACQPQAFADITAIKNDAWRVTDKNGAAFDGFRHATRALIFTTHAMAHDFSGPSLSKAWLHPDFDPANIDDHDAWAALGTQFHLYRLIHDEASLSDLVHIESAKNVKTAHKFRKLVKFKSGKDWSKVSQSLRYQIFNVHSSKKMKKLGFHDLCRIIDVGFSAEDLTTVDFHAHPFGINNSNDAMYLGTHGTEYYVKPQRWWLKQRARVLITTTEALVAKVALRINRNNANHWIPQIRVHRLDDDEFVTPDSVRLRRDKRASKSKIDNLVKDRLADGMDFVISDMADGSHNVLSTHASARGRNDLQSKHISTILTFIAKDQYCRLNVVAQKFGIDGIYRDHYRDQLNQAAGRNCGLRKNHATPYDHEIIVSPTLHRCLGGTSFFAAGRYPAYLTP